MKPNPFAAQLLEASAAAYAGFATSLLLERHPEVEERFAPSAMTYWKANLTQRVRELAAAVTVGEASLFSARIDWARQAFRGRQVPEEDLRHSLTCLREILKDELPQNATAETTEILDRALAEFDRPLAKSGATLDPNDPGDQLALEYLLAVLEGDSRRAVDLVVEAVEGGLDVRKAYLDVLLPAQREVGRLWHAGELSIAEEHFVTATTRQAMSLLSRLGSPAGSNGKTVVAASVAGNVHDLGVRVIADFFELDGWRSACLGADVPPTEIADAVTYFDADLLVLSAALSTHLKALDESIRAVRKGTERDVKIMVGGLAFSSAPELWRRLGADGYSTDGDSAVAVGSQLVGLDG